MCTTSRSVQVSIAILQASLPMRPKPLIAHFWTPIMLTRQYFGTFVIFEASRKGREPKLQTRIHVVNSRHYADMDMRIFSDVCSSMLFLVYSCIRPTAGQSARATLSSFPVIADAYSSFSSFLVSGNCTMTTAQLVGGVASGKQRTVLSAHFRS